MNTPAGPSTDPAATAAVAIIPAPLVAVPDMSISFPAEEATVVVALVAFAGANPAIASVSSNAIPMEVNSAWRYEDTAEKFSLVVTKTISALMFCVIQSKDIRDWVEDADLVVEF